MRFWRPLSIYLVIASLIVSTASAHKGGTDDSGGHYDHSTGEYHYHHGYSAHDHADMDGDGYKDCPFDFDDKTGWNSGSSSGSGSKNAGEQTPVARVPVTQREKITFWDIVLAVFGCLLSFGAPIMFLLAVIIERIQKFFNDLKSRNARKKRIAELKEKLSNTTCREYAGVPVGVKFDDDLYPESINGVSQIVYVTDSGGKYHRDHCRYAKGARKTNVYMVYRNKCACSLCRPPVVVSTPDWAYQYREAMRLKRQYALDDPDLHIKNKGV